MSESVESGSPENSASANTETPSVSPMLPAIAGPIVVRARLSRVVVACHRNGAFGCCRIDRRCDGRRRLRQAATDFARRRAQSSK